VITPKKTSTIINFDFNNSKMRYSYNITDMNIKLPNIDLNTKLKKLEKAKINKTRNQFNKTMASIDFVNPKDKKWGPRIRIPSATKSDSSSTKRKKKLKASKLFNQKKLNKESELKRMDGIHEHHGTEECENRHLHQQRTRNRHVHGHAFKNASDIN
jgi:hypothetical protein